MNPCAHCGHPRAWHLDDGDCMCGCMLWEDPLRDARRLLAALREEEA